ncbi:hypothetical protein ACRS6B_06175 [Nocardia asteroides]
MEFEAITAAVFMAVAAVGITAATAHAEQAVTEQPTAVHTGDTVSGVDREIITSSPFRLSAWSLSPSGTVDSRSHATVR